MLEPGTYVRMHNGIIGLFLWSYENPVHRRGVHDRASIGVGIETWCANLNGLQSVQLGPTTVGEVLEYLRGEIRAERISYSELIELQGLVEHIDPSDVELREWAGLPEYPDEVCETCGGDPDYCPCDGKDA